MWYLIISGVLAILAIFAGLLASSVITGAASYTADTTYTIVGIVVLVIFAGYIGLTLTNYIIIIRRFYNNIFGMSISEEDNNLVPKQIVSDVAIIKKIVLPSGLKELTPNCFHSIQKGKTISVPKTLKKNIRALCNLQWKKVTINKGNKKYKVKSGCLISKSGKTFYGYLETKSSVKIPNRVKTIAEGAIFLNDNLKVVYIPKTVSKIKEKLSFLLCEI